MIKQLSVFVDNKPGRLKAVTGLLNEKSINIRAITIQNRHEFGIMNIIVDKPDEAHVVLTDNGFACAVKRILAIFLGDRPGGLDSVLRVFADNHINIKDAYAFVIESGSKAVFCVDVEDNEKVIELLKKNGLTLIEEKDLYGI
jgi:hypothetical protein